MKQIIFSACLFTIMACNNESADSKKVTSLPAAPVSMEDVRKKVGGHTYETEEVGFIQTFMGKQEPPMWSGDMKDTSKMFRDFVADRKKFSLQFLTDSTVNVVEEEKAIAAQYELEKDTSNAILLLVKYEDESFSFPGADGPMMMTYTYKIKGIDDERMFLELPRNYNQRTIANLMKKKKANSQ